jgi:hypothetical protein
MWNFMDVHQDVFTGSNAEGIERVKESNGKYAFFMESASIEYIMERHCDLARAGRELDAKGYGIGGPGARECYLICIRSALNSILVG